VLHLCSVFFDDMNPSWNIDESPAQHNMLILVVHGKLCYILNGQMIHLEKGDLLYVPIGTLRAGVNDTSGPHQKYSAHFLIDAPDKFPLSNPAVFRRTRTRNFEYLRQRFSILIQQWFAQLPYYETICYGIVVELLGYSSRETDDEHVSPIKLRLMKKVQEYIILHYREPIRIAELAELIERAPNYVTQTFKEVSGLTPISYLHQLRVHSARDLILNTGMTIGEVSSYLGYSDQAHFNRVFKKILGYPPSKVIRE
jgi:AraC-like DNA-binding protein